MRSGDSDGGDGGDGGGGDGGGDDGGDGGGDRSSHTYDSSKLDLYVEHRWRHTEFIFCCRLQVTSFILFMKSREYCALTS